MPTTNPPPRVWTNQVDKKYDVYVERITGETHKGNLKIELNGEILHREPVVIMFGGPFGPDAQDVDDWCNKCIKFVDARESALKAIKPVIGDKESPVK